MASTKNNNNNSSISKKTDIDKNSNSSSSNKNIKERKTSDKVTNRDDENNLDYPLRERDQEPRLSEFEKQMLKELKGIRKTSKNILKFLKKQNK